MSQNEFLQHHGWLATSIFEGRRGGGGGGQVVVKWSACLLFYSDHPSLNPAEVYNVSVKL